MMSALIPMSSPLRPDPQTPPRRRLYKNRDFSSPSSAPDHPRKAFLRERFKQRCFERAQHAREKQVKRSRWSVGNAPSSDDFDHEMDDDEHEDSVINDELFRRIMASARHKTQHNFRLSYQLDVGSSIDPDLEDTARWESELQHNSTIEEAPDEFDDDELAAYAEECALHADLEAFADDIFSLSDFEDFGDIDENLQSTALTRGKQKAHDGDIDMSN